MKELILLYYSSGDNNIHFKQPEVTGKSQHFENWVIEVFVCWYLCLTISVHILSFCNMEKNIPTIVSGQRIKCFTVHVKKRKILKIRVTTSSNITKYLCIFYIQGNLYSFMTLHLIHSKFTNKWEKCPPIFLSLWW